MTIKFTVTVNAGPRSAVNDGSHPSFRRICGLLDGHGIPATWILDTAFMTEAVAGIAVRHGRDATDMASTIQAMITPQDIHFVDHGIGAEKHGRPARNDHETDPSNPTQLLTDRQLRHLTTGFARVIMFRRGLQQAIRTGADFDLTLDPDLLTSTGRSCGFLENIIFGAAEHQIQGRIKFATIDEIRLRNAIAAPALGKSAA